MYIPSMETMLELEEDAEESDIDLVPPEEARLEMTERAAEVRDPPLLCGHLH